MQTQQMRFKMGAAQQLMNALANGGGGLLSGSAASMVGSSPSAATGAGAAPGGSGMPTGIDQGASGGAASGGAAPSGAGGMIASGLVAPGGAGGAPASASDPLALIRHFESGGNYNVGYGGVDLSNAPRDQYGFPIWEGAKGPDGQPTHAFGAYQI